MCSSKMCSSSIRFIGISATKFKNLKSFLTGTLRPIKPVVFTRWSLLVSCRGDAKWVLLERRASCFPLFHLPAVASYLAYRLSAIDLLIQLSGRKTNECVSQKVPERFVLRKRAYCEGCQSNQLGKCR